MCLCTKSYPTLCDPLDHGPPGLLCPWDSPGKDTGVCCHFLPRGSPTQESHKHLLHWQADSLLLSHRGAKIPDAMVHLSPCSTTGEKTAHSDKEPAHSDSSPGAKPASDLSQEYTNIFFKNSQKPFTLKKTSIWSQPCPAHDPSTAPYSPPPRTQAPLDITQSLSLYLQSHLPPQASSNSISGNTSRCGPLMPWPCYASMPCQRPPKGRMACI